jgi:drug/metabolite transporter (DMT)-like permease
MENIKGFIYGIVTAVTFGLIPMFTLPLMEEGMRHDSILVYRFLFTVVALALMLLSKKESFKVERKQLPVLLLLGTLYTSSAMFLFWGYEMMSAGIATTLHFTYPVFVTLMMGLVFKEKISYIVSVAIVMAIAGVARLSISGGQLELSGFSVLIVLLSAVAYALYIVTVNKSNVRLMSGRKITFYVFLVSTVMITIKTLLSDGSIQAIPSIGAMLNLSLLAIVPTVISAITLVMAVKRIGGTLTSVLGAIEPITAVVVGILMFGEPFSPRLAAGIVLILSAVTIIILQKPIKKAFYKAKRRLR